MAVAFLRVVPEREILGRRYLAISGQPGLEVNFVVEGKANLHAALDMVVIMTVRLRTVKRYSLFVLADDTTLVRLFCFDSV